LLKEVFLQTLNYRVPFYDKNECVVVSGLRHRRTRGSRICHENSGFAELPIYS
jgi:hypothetical protein